MIRAAHRLVVGVAVVGAFLAGAPAAIAQTAKPAAPTSSAAPEIKFRAQGGLVFNGFNAVGTGWAGFLGGAGIDATPFANKQMAIEADGDYYRYRGTNNFTFSGNVLYYLAPDSAQPRGYVGGGMAFTHTYATLVGASLTFVATNGINPNVTATATTGTLTANKANLEVVAGVALPQASSSRVLRGEVRLIFSASVSPAVLLLGGITF